jgi:hypothetical protein
MKKLIIWTSVVVIILGTVIVYLVYNKQQQDSLKNKSYRSAPSDSMKIVYLANADTIAKAKDGVANLLYKLSNYFDAVIWITTTPDSFPSADPLDPRIKYYTSPNDSEAILLAKKIFIDNGWPQTARIRYIFHSNMLISSQEEMIKKLVKDGIIITGVQVGYNYTPLK